MTDRFNAKTSKLFFACACSLAFSGCWTFNESPYPKVEIRSVQTERAPAIGVLGFSATTTEYLACHDFRTVYVPGYCGRHYFHPGYYETVPTVSYLPQMRSTDAYLRRAKDAFERAGFAVGAMTPDITVDVEFVGPIAESGDMSRQLAWSFGTLFFCDFGAAAWTAKVRVRENRTGKLVHSFDLMQRYETNVFGLIPLFSISSARETTFGHMQNWCLSALTDRVVADVTAALRNDARGVAK